ncbi:MAG TPA: META domain-containing protein [Gemmatimonadota bacterium]|jgi:heat shock protein HslJ
MLRYAVILSPLVLLSACSGAPAELAGSRWTLTQLGDAPVATADPERVPYLIFESAGRVGGHGGCNQFGGDYAIEGSTIAITGTVATLMACTDGMATEKGFLAALESARSYRIEGQRLDLLDANGALLARFEATP